MPASAPICQVVHTRLWKDQDLNRNRMPVIRRFKKKPPHQRYTCATGSPLASICMLHHGMEEGTFDYSSCPSQSQLSLQNYASNKLPQNTTFANDETLVTYPDTRNALSLLHAEKRRRTLEGPKLSMVDELNISGRAVPYAEIEIANGIGITPSEPNHFCEFPSSRTGTRDLEDGNAMLQQAGTGTNCASKSGDGFSDVDEYQNWVWQSFNNWVEYMYPNASRESD